VALLVEALRYKPEGCVSMKFFIGLRPQYGPCISSAPNRNKYQGYLLGAKGGQFVGLKTLPPSCAECLEIWGTSIA